MEGLFIWHSFERVQGSLFYGSLNQHRQWMKRAFVMRLAGLTKSTIKTILFEIKLIITVPYSYHYSPPKESVGSSAKHREIRFVCCNLSQKVPKNDAPYIAIIFWLKSKLRIKWLYKVSTYEWMSKIVSVIRNIRLKSRRCQKSNI